MDELTKLRNELTLVTQERNALRKKLDEAYTVIRKADFDIRGVRRLYFHLNPPNTGLAAGFNGVLGILEGQFPPMSDDEFHTLKTEGT